MVQSPKAKDIVGCSREYDFMNKNSLQIGFDSKIFYLFLLICKIDSNLFSLENIMLSPSTNRNRCPNTIPQKTNLFDRYDELKNNYQANNRKGGLVKK